MRTIAYVRVSTDRQDVENQRLEILKLANDLGLGRVEMVDEVVSGRRPWRERSIAPILLNDLAAGDTLIVAELSRLGRSMLEIMEMLAHCAQAQIHVYAAKGGWRLDGSLQSKIVAMVLAMAAEIERDLISQRTRAALATRRAQGVQLGRPRGPGKSRLDAHAVQIRELLDLGVPQKRIAKIHGTTEQNLAHWMTRRGIPTARRRSRPPKAAPTTAGR
ncbi:MAG: recombinase family protein [Syntrophales bacterium]|jgi:DNA invertase Pin-like site-specific DNA recombinase|nr:recombinase family protein [Dehalococcoidia bacterium]MDD4339222.1 recombinase family protein [Syntrophales bacterium]